MKLVIKILKMLLSTILGFIKSNASYQNDLQYAQTSKVPQIASHVEEMNNRLQQTKTQNLEGNQRIQYEDIKSEIHAITEKANIEYDAVLQQIQPQVPVLENKAKQAIIIQIVTIIIGIVLCVIGAKYSGSLLAIGFIVVVASFLVKKFIIGSVNKTAGELAAMNHNVLLKWLSYFGESDVVDGVTGIYKRVDDLYLSSLDSTERGFTISQRQQQKQMRQMQEAHQQQMQQMANQTAVLQSEIRNLAK